MPRQNTGSVFQRKDGFWIAQVTIKGKRIVKCANSQEEAEQLRKELLTPSDRVEVPAIPVKPTLRTFLPQYIKAANLKPLTSDVTNRHITTHILPLIGDRNLEDIKPLDIVTVQTVLIEKGLA